MKCTDGMCLVVTQTKKKLPKSTGIKDRESLCSHLQTMAENIDFVKSFSPHYLHKEKVKLQEKQKKLDLKLNKKILMMLDYNQTKLTTKLNN